MGTHSLYSGWWRLFSKGNCSFLKSGGVEKTGRQTETERGHALHPCHSLHSLYHLCDSWWIMDETIDRWAQLCSTDPLRTHISNLITTSWEISSYFSLTNNQNHFSHSHVCQPARILGIFYFFSHPMYPTSKAHFPTGKLPPDHGNIGNMFLFRQIMQSVKDVTFEMT